MKTSMWTLVIQLISAFKRTDLKKIKQSEANEKSALLSQKDMPLTAIIWQHCWCESVKGGLCDKCMYGRGQQGARLTSFKLGTTRSRASVITELCPAQNVVGVTLIRIMCCMNNTATSTHHTLPRCLGSAVPGHTCLL